MSVPSHAMMPPPAKMIDQTVEPSCITVQPSWLSWQPAAWGTGSKGPAVQIKNDCPDQIVITGFEISVHGETAKKQIGLIDVLLTHEGIIGGTQYTSFIFADSDENCGTEKLEDFLIERERQRLEINYRELLEVKREMEKMPSGAPPPNIGTLDEYIRENLKPDEAKKLGKKKVACKELLISTGDALRVGIPWGDSYVIRGYHAGLINEQAPVHIEGKMINPGDPTGKKSKRPE